ncbi:MAG: hypothetical protein O3C57_03790, partial [Verrucomicrobia bacterium]|nr:hypothetical protein [Verrucomicrobiota bacterium]
MNYYYFAASLPSLDLDGALPLSSSNFASLCREHLSPAHAQAIDALSDESLVSAHPFVKAWRELDAQIRNPMATFRAARQNLDAAAFTRADIPFNAEASKAVTDAFELKNPMQRE